MSITSVAPNPGVITHRAERVEAVAALLHDVIAEMIECRSRDQREHLHYILAELLECEASRLVAEARRLEKLGGKAVVA